MVQPIKIFIECVGIIMDIQVLLLIIHRRGALIMSANSRTRMVITLDVTRVEMRY
jgi:hypothetical protein